MSPPSQHEPEDDIHRNSHLPNANFKKSAAKIRTEARGAEMSKIDRQEWLQARQMAKYPHFLVLFSGIRVFPLATDLFFSA
jgi:hypothetical protein